jgi:PIN domain nuclease of toxin-antitoxin system
MLVAQALVEDLVIVSADEALGAYKVPVVWS